MRKPSIFRGIAVSLLRPVIGSNVEIDDLRVRSIKYVVVPNRVLLLNKKCPNYIQRLQKTKGTKSWKIKHKSCHVRAGVSLNYVHLNHSITMFATISDKTVETTVPQNHLHFYTPLLTLPFPLPSPLS